MTNSPERLVPGRKTLFGMAPDGSEVYRIELGNGIAEAAVFTFGASLQHYRIRDVPHSLVLGSHRFEDYLKPQFIYFGPVVGRVANRIANGRAMLDGQLIELDRNEAGTTVLHGGSTGSSQRNWQLEHHDETSCQMSLLMADGENGFPGNLKVSVTYSLDGEGALVVDLEAQTDKPTFCNFAQHSYWNLDGSPDVKNHLLTIQADEYLPVDEQNIPLGTPASVAGTSFDYRQPAPIVHAGQGIDHNFCLRGLRGDFREIAVLSARDIALHISTTEAGFQVYDGTHLDAATSAGPEQKTFGRHAGVALEPQAWPDAPNHEGYPSVILRPGETYRQKSRFHARHR